MKGPRNTLTDLNNHLFEQLERLNDSDIDEEKLELEINRSKGMTNISKTILEGQRLHLDTAKFLDGASITTWEELPRELTSGHRKEGGEQ